MRTGRRLHPPDDEPYRRGVRLGVRLGLERGVGGLGHIGGAVHPVRNGRPGIFGYRLDEIPQAGALADGDGEADIHPAADGDHGVGIEAAVGPHRELAPGSAVAHPPTMLRFTQEVGMRRGRSTTLRCKRCRRRLEQHYAESHSPAQTVQPWWTTLPSLAMKRRSRENYVESTGRLFPVSPMDASPGPAPAFHRPGPARLARGSPGPVGGHGPT